MVVILHELYTSKHLKVILVGFKKNSYIMEENGPFSEYIKIPLGRNRTNGAVYYEINFSHPMLQSISLTFFEIMLILHKEETVQQELKIKSRFSYLNF